ncbi:ankyrin repeat and sterile alpha motif domain-containing protein 1B-like [Salvelinus sp. IW2-2015]|uniref:ankyrin repeat and sterile alpha motif domain-containing protein 1B-like n=1 Tax=Salvelinus sp. IW2-2015 TaxID=2691554 RepID=UPI000CEADB34|nr:ankyrin repeat and sterile alpha motif domain-containing protein 1B-like [Salvelinus alpinus]
MMEEMMDNKSMLMEEPIRQCPVPTPRTSIPSPSASPSLRHKNDAVTGELSKLLNEMKMCRDRDYSFEELCQTISSHSHSMESFGSGHLSDEERRSNGTLSRVRKVSTILDQGERMGPGGIKGDVKGEDHFGSGRKDGTQE